MSTENKPSGTDASHTEPGLIGGQSPPRPLKHLRFKAQTWLPLFWEFLASFSLFFLMESSSEMFRQEIIYVSAFQRHSTCKRERGKANIKTNLAQDRFFSLRLKNVYCSSSPLSFQLYDVIKVPFAAHYFQMIQTLGILLMFACNEIYFSI